MPHPAINPELIKAAMLTAHPERECTLVTADYAWSGNRAFNPLTSDSDAWALMCELLKQGWGFRHENGGSLGDVFWAENPFTHLTIWSGKMNRLMLAVVSAQTGIPLHANQTENKP